MLAKKTQSRETCNLRFVLWLLEHSQYRITSIKKNNNKLSRDFAMNEYHDFIFENHDFLNNDENLYISLK